MRFENCAALVLEREWGEKVGDQRGLEGPGEMGGCS